MSKKQIKLWGDWHRSHWEGDGWMALICETPGGLGADRYIPLDAISDYKALMSTAAGLLGLDWKEWGDVNSHRLLTIAVNWALIGGISEENGEEINFADFIIYKDRT